MAEVKNTSRKVRYWQTASPSFTFPEQAEGDMAYAPVQSRPSTGICLSGGGTISAALISGYLKALHELGLLDQLGYISGVSGGAWASTPFTYLPKHISDEQFLGPKYLPEEITRWKLRFAKRGSLIRAVTKAQIANRTVLNGIHLTDAFSRAVGEIFLQPFGIPSPKTRRRKTMYFTSTEAVRDDIIARNPSLHVDDFLLMRPNRPFLIVNGVIFVEKQGVTPGADDFHALPFEFTPLYAGAPVRYPYPGKDGQTIGGSYVEPLGFNSTPISKAHNGIMEVSEAQRFQLCDPLGTSGAAIAKLLVEWDSALKLLFPQYQYWNPSGIEPEKPQTYEFGDSGVLENLGVLPLLIRRVQNIVVFSTEPFDPAGQLHSVDISERAERLFGYNQIAALFGQQIYDLDPRSPQYEQLIDDPLQRQVFRSEEFAPLAQGLRDSQANGGPVAFSGEFTVVDNPTLGVQGGWTCRMVWMVVDTCTAWEKALPDRIGKRIGRVGPLRNFPIVRVFGQNLPHVIQLTRLQANMLGNLGYWMVMEKRAELEAIFGKDHTTTGV